MMRGSLLFILYFRLVSATDWAAGFHLSLDYGVVSLYFANGTTRELSKVAVGAKYREMMRSAYDLDEDVSSQHLESYNSGLDMNYELPQFLIGLPGIRDRLPPWMRGQDPRAKALVPMLKALKTVAESSLEASLKTAEIVVPFRSSTTLREVIVSAATSVSLQAPKARNIPAGIWAADAYNVGNACALMPEDPDTEPQMILTVEFTKSALTGLLLHEVCEIFIPHRVLHDTALGLDQADEPPYQSYMERLQNELARLIKLPLDDGEDFEPLTRINNVVVLGESANSPILHQALKSVLQEQYSRLTVNAEENIDPLFDAANAAAKTRYWDLFEEEHCELRHRCP